MNYIHEKAIVLRTTDYRESDILVNVINEKGCKKGFIARGAKRSRKRFGGGVLEVSNVLEVVYKEGKDGRLVTLEEAKLLHSFDSLRSNYKKLMLSFEMIKLVSKIVVEAGEGQAELYRVLGNSLKGLELTLNSEKLYLHFLVKIINAIGVMPEDADLTNFLSHSISANESVNYSDSLLDGSIKKYEQIFDNFVSYANPLL